MLFPIQVEIQMSKSLLNKLDVDFSELAIQCGTNFRKIKIAAAEKKAEDREFFNQILEAQTELKEQINAG